MPDAKIEDFSKEISLKEELIDEDEPDINKEEAVALYSRSMAFSISYGLVSPFVSFIALTMGATAGILAWIQAIANLLRQFLDPIFGRLSDISKRRIPFIVVSTVTWILPYAFLFWVRSPLYIILIVAAVNILMSLGNPAWIALQNELFPAKARGKLTGRVTWFGSFGSMIATFFTGIVLTYAFEDIDYQQTILIPVALGLII
jgi:MFS family permease